MSLTKEQDRARERRRWEKREQRLAERRAQSVRDKQAILAVVGVLVVVIGFVWLANVLTNRTDTATPDATPTTAATTEPTSDATTSATPSVTPTVLPGCSTPPANQTAVKKPTSQPDVEAAKGKTFVATVKTTCGDITVDLNGAAAPAAVSSWILLAKDGYWAPSPCHRLTTDSIFVLQCGDPTGTGRGPGPGYHFGVENVPADDSYPRGALAMARKSGDPNSNGDQFFIVYKDTTLPKSADGNGYTIFGTVTQGMDIVDKIAAAGVNPSNHTSPLAPIDILSVDVQPKA